MRASESCPAEQPAQAAEWKQKLAVFEQAEAAKKPAAK